MVRRVPASACAALVAVALVIALCFGLLCLGPLPTATAQETPRQNDATSSVDDALVQALTGAGLLDVWVEASNISASAALVDVLGDETYQLGRVELLNELDRLTEHRVRRAERAAKAEQLVADVGALEVQVRALRRDVSATGRIAAVSLTPHIAEEALATLAAINGSRRWLAVSLDPLALAEHRLIDARDDTQREIDSLLRDGQRQKSGDSSVARFTAVHADLQRVRTLIDAANQRAIVGEFEYAAHREAIVETFSDLHHLRVLRPTSVGGLPVVTLDAYVRGAQALDASCPVDWALLAGIGRVESRHGTIDDTTVQRSGRVSKAILGPLLDGGATAREAEQAQADAAAEESLLLADAEAEDPEPEFDATLWGITPTPTPTPEAEEQPPSQFDPLLWGDDLPFDEDDSADLDDTDGDEAGDEDEEEPEFKGNGFAVIRDSDNGRLDGNSRWDRAVGPMQFIPETWSYWETDGNGDGVIDPQNLYDAAATAGQFLCHLSRTRGVSPYNFVLGYNSSQTYVRNVMAVADAFGANELPTG